MNFFFIFAFIFHPQSSYFLGPDPLTFSQAEAYCQSQSSHLASIHSSASFFEAQDLCETVTNPQACWTGLHTIGASNEWNYTDGSDADFGFSPIGIAAQGQKPPWISSPPQPSGGEPCVEFLGYADFFYWNDRRCDHGNYPICNGANNITTTSDPTTTTGSTTQTVTDSTVTTQIATTSTMSTQIVTDSTFSTQTSDSDSYDSYDAARSHSYDDIDDDSYDAARSHDEDIIDLNDLFNENDNWNSGYVLYFDVSLSSYTWLNIWIAIFIFIILSVTSIWCLNRKCQSQRVT